MPGTNKNTNGLLSQFFPKGTRFTQVSRAEIKRIQAMFNDRPRKILFLPPFSDSEGKPWGPIGVMVNCPMISIEE